MYFYLILGGLSVFTQLTVGVDFNSGN